MNPRLREMMIVMTWLKSVGVGAVANENDSPDDATAHLYRKAAELIQPAPPRR
ncbi:MAG TPA: hypothetical protein VEH84_01180 [Alphaproteobacteria bacterium]|nr:hypothetical protein [Alphaproteobacteria bacterium]